MKKSLFLLPALAMLWSCGGNKSNDASAQSDNEGLQLDSLELHGEWKLTSYRVDSVCAEFGDSVDYRLIIDETADNFSIFTGCNYISGSFSGTNDTIRLHNVLVTEMACDDMTVEQNMLKLVNDQESYAIRVNDTINYLAPSVGEATFVRMANDEQIVEE